MEEEVRQFYRSVGRNRLKELWGMVKSGTDNDLEGEDRRIADAMAEHREEYFEEFESADTRVLDPETDTDAFLHVCMHSSIEGQLESKDPIEALQLYNALRKKKSSHHDAVHLLVAIFVPFLFEVLKNGVEFDREGYRKWLKKAKGKKPEKIWEMLDREVYAEEDDPDDLVDRVFQFKIELVGIEPTIWRRVRIPALASFRDFHHALQDAMGWEDAHLHRFEVLDPATGRLFFIGRPLEDDGWEDNTLPGWQYTVSDFIDFDHPECRYIYDYGDNWEHRIVLEDVLAQEPAADYPLCLAGERACPPEDVGGIAGYGDLLDILKDPSHERHPEIRERIGDFDPDKFDPENVFFTRPGGE